MFRAYLDPSSGGTIVWNERNQDNRESSNKNNKYQLYTNGVPPDDGPRYARNV